MNGLHELPLVIFTVLAQSVVGALLLFVLALMTAQDKHYRAYVHKAMFALVALLGIGFIGSLTHLGTPLRALNSLNRVGESMMSNEIASGAGFFALFGSYWLLAVLGKMPKALGNLWLILTAVVGCVFMYYMNAVYHIPTVPTWNSASTTWSFYLTIILGGFTLGYTLLQSERPDAKILALTPWAVAVATFFAAVVAVYQGFSFSGIVTSAQNASALVPDFASLSAVRLACLGLGGALLFYISKKPTALWAKVLAVLLMLGGEMIGRTLFYALHMTVGMAVGA